MTTINKLADKFEVKKKPEGRQEVRRAIEDIKLARELGIDVRDFK